MFYCKNCVFAYNYGRIYGAQPTSLRLYGKLKYVRRLDYLREHVMRNKMEVLEFVCEHDEDLEYQPMMDYGMESDHPMVYGAPAGDSSVGMYSTRCIS
ncbi:hypothetical protein L1987_34264 [Smallanthus sonchifolius]|uniref:Uncharacterized protein n=1 Tax=Smallanthus sonchifolius TaxID=185202 RepID=A0ACB9HUJ7_9ASTR|nr:hypothetical protein L1987_34264 [Smallanthus sonchifolius]